MPDKPILNQVNGLDDVIDFKGSGGEMMFVILMIKKQTL